MSKKLFTATDLATLLAFSLLVVLVWRSGFPSTPVDLALTVTFIGPQRLRCMHIQRAQACSQVQAKLESPICFIPRDPMRVVISLSFVSGRPRLLCVY